MPTRRNNYSACTNFSKTRRLCTEPCKYVFKQLKDANSGMTKTVGYCKTKYNHLKKHGKKTKHHRRILKKMSKDIQKLEKATVVAQKANDDVSKIGMNMEVPSVADITKSVGNFFSTAAPTAPTEPIVAETKTEESVPVKTPEEEAEEAEAEVVVKGGK
jgi:hypothetical protein